MMLGHPEGVIAEPVHALGVGHRLVQHTGQFLVRIPAVVDRGAGVARVLQIDRAVVGAVEFRNHWAPPSAASALLRTRWDFNTGMNVGARRTTARRSLNRRPAIRAEAPRPKPDRSRCSPSQ